MHDHTDVCTQRIPFSNRFLVRKKESRNKRQIMFPVGAWRHFLNLEVKVYNGDVFLPLFHRLLSEI